MSIQLVLSHYLAGLRERNELDALLPDLLKAMGHSVLSRPQIGVAQAGVDVVSTRENEDGTLEVFLFVIKFGDIGRNDFYGGPQSIDPSIREASNDFVRNRLPAPIKDLHKRIVLVTNGVLKQEAQAGFSALSHDVAERTLCTLELWGTDQLTPLIEKHLFDEALLLSKGKSDLRAALAGLEETETTTIRFVRFIESCFHSPEDDTSESHPTIKRKFLRQCAAASMGWAVLLTWGHSEGNLKPGVIAGEYLALRMWTEAVKRNLTTDEIFTERFDTVISLQVKSLLEYFEKIMPQLQSRRAVTSYRPDRIIYSELIFEELGRLATLLIILQTFEGQDELRGILKEQLIRLINEHTGCRLPVYDGQTIDLTLIFSALMGESDWNNTQSLVADITSRLYRAIKTRRYLPVDTDLLEDAVILDTSQNPQPLDFFKTSTLIPALATTSAFLGDEETLKNLRDDICPLLENVTLERWFPDASIETLTGSRRATQTAGVSRAVAVFRATASEEAEASLKLFQGAADPTEFKWHGKPAEILVAISARIHRHPLPTWFLGKHRA